MGNFRDSTELNVLWSFLVSQQKKLVAMRATAVLDYALSIVHFFSA
jgi:hypothetical protein